jgi:methionine-rich copper-binding protein CopC
MKLPAFAASVALTLSAFGNVAYAQTPQMMDSYPKASAVMDGRETQFFIRFDRPVDHRNAQLQVVQDGHVLQMLTPRLDSAPNTIYSGARRLAPGNYELRWNVRSITDREVANGVIHFTVRAPS